MLLPLRARILGGELDRVRVNEWDNDASLWLCAPPLALGMSPEATRRMVAWPSAGALSLGFRV
jgi:hypothetical protein